MTKLNISGSNVGAKGICAVIDTDNTILPCGAIDNGNGSAILKIVLYGTQLDGTITPVLVDSDGKIVTA